MTVYVDDAFWPWQGLKWCHLLADDLDELHRFAARLGVHRASYQGLPKTRAPHYDLTAFERKGDGARCQGLQPRGDRRGGSPGSGEAGQGALGRHRKDRGVGPGDCGFR
jgi:hypothetical protein